MAPITKQPRTVTSVPPDAAGRGTNDFKYQVIGMLVPTWGHLCVRDPVPMGTLVCQGPSAHMGTLVRYGPNAHRTLVRGPVRILRALSLGERLWDGVLCSSRSEFCTGQDAVTRGWSGGPR